MDTQRKAAIRRAAIVLLDCILDALPESEGTPGQFDPPPLRPVARDWGIRPVREPADHSGGE